MQKLLATPQNLDTRVTVAAATKKAAKLSNPANGPVQGWFRRRIGGVVDKRKLKQPRHSKLAILRLFQFTLIFTSFSDVANDKLRRERDHS